MLKQQRRRDVWCSPHLAALFLLDDPVYLLIYFLQGTIVLEHLLVCTLENKSDACLVCVGMTSRIS